MGSAEDDCKKKDAEAVEKYVNQQRRSVLFVDRQIKEALRKMRQIRGD